MSLKQWKYTNGYEPYETLPEVNSEDNGKVLGVSEGQYALVSGGGGGGAEPLIVNATETGIDATYNELKAAILAGRQVWVHFDNGEDEEAYYSCNTISIETGDYIAVFSNTTYHASDADTDMSYPDYGD